MFRKLLLPQNETRSLPEHDLKYYRETDLDFVKIMCDGYFPYPLPEIKTAADWKSLKAPRKCCTVRWPSAV